MKQNSGGIEGQHNKMLSLNEQTKMLLFARWISTDYADEHIDANMHSQHEKGFDASTELSVLNRQSGTWWKQQLEYFNKVVYPNYLKSGTVADMRKFLEQK